VSDRFDTSLSDIETLRLAMEDFVNSPENKRDFQSDIVLRCVGVGTMDKLQLQLEVQLKVYPSLLLYRFKDLLTN
jgi:hypothetical protein